MFQYLTIHRSRIILGLISGMLLTLSFPKADLGWLAWIALVPFLLALRKASPRQGFAVGLWTGLVHNIGLLYWTVHTMHVYGGLPLLQCVMVLFLLAAYVALYFGAFGLLVTWLGNGALKLVLIAPAAWTTMEMLRTHLFTGFPWELLGYSQHEALWILQVADLFGVYGVSALIVIVNTAVVLALLLWLEKPWQGSEITRRQAVRTVIVSVALLASVGIYGAVRMGSVDEAAAAAPKTKVAVVQGNIDQAQKWDPAFQMLTVVKYNRLSEDAVAQGAELIVWPETATPFYFLQENLLSRIVLEGIKNAGRWFFIGSPSFKEDVGQVDYFNSAYLISPEGDVKGKYDKVHLVPFGEYVPLQRFLPFIEKMVAQVGDFQTGQPGNTLLWEQQPIGTLICYEVIFPALARAMADNGARVLLNITNDAWFGRTAATYQHFSMAVFRAVENRRPLARAANTGISGFIDASGRVLARTDLFIEAVQTRELALLGFRTHYMQWGDWPLGLAAVGVLATTGATRLGRTPRPARKRRP